MTLISFLYCVYQPFSLFSGFKEGEDKRRNLTRSEKYQSAAQLGIEPNIARGLSIKERSNIFVKSNDETPVCCVQCVMHWSCEIAMKSKSVGRKHQFMNFSKLSSQKSCVHVEM